MLALLNGAHQDGVALNFARTYLDYNASAPLLPEAHEAMIAALELTGNPSSVHAEGRRLRGIIETAREQVAALVGARPADVVFTSGASEANATVLSRGWAQIYLTGLEHPSVLEPARGGGAKIHVTGVLHDGIIDAGELGAHILRTRHGSEQSLIALQLANNETGVIQPVAEVAEFAREHGLAVHTDAVQAAGRVAVDFAALDVDTMALSAHKLGGPQGVGAVIIRDGIDFAPLIRGGGQERRRRAGTENVAGIAGFGAAAAVAAARLPDMARVGELRDYMEAALCQIAGDKAGVIGHNAPRLANTCSISVITQAGDMAVIKFDLAGFAVSAGSACSSGKIGASGVLESMGLAPNVVRGAIRISLGHATTRAEADAFIQVWKRIVGPGVRQATMETDLAGHSGIGE